MIIASNELAIGSNEWFIFVIVSLIIVAAIGFMVGVLQYIGKCETEQKLNLTQEYFKDVLEKILKKDPQNVEAKIAYASYFGKPVDHAGDGFIDGCE